MKVVNERTEVHCPVVEMATRAKLSCLSWNKYSKNIIASSDYEGIVNVWDVNTRQVQDVLLYYLWLLFCKLICIQVICTFSCLN